MKDMSTALAESRAAVDELIASCDRCGTNWTTPRAPGKWSPSQNVEHVALALEESAKMATGAPSGFPNLPFFVRPIVRSLLLNRVVNGKPFPKAKTNKAMNPLNGPASPADGRARLASAHEAFDQACRATGGKLTSTVFGPVSVSDYATFMAAHTRHHLKQMGN